MGEEGSLVATVYCDKHNYLYDPNKGCPLCKDIPIERKACHLCGYFDDCQLGGECSNEGYRYFIKKI